MENVIERRQIIERRFNIERREPTQTQKWATYILKSIRKCQVDIFKASVFKSDDYYKALNAIVNPSGIDSEYGDWIESDGEKWIGFIIAICGDEWGLVAELYYING